MGWWVDAQLGIAHGPEEPHRLTWFHRAIACIFKRVADVGLVGILSTVQKFLLRQDPTDDRPAPYKRSKAGNRRDP